MRTKGSALAATDRRLIARRGVQKAIVAIAHRLILAIYHVLLRRAPYRAPDLTGVDERRKAALLQRMQHRIAQLGDTVTLQPTEATAA